MNGPNKQQEGGTGMVTDTKILRESYKDFKLKTADILLVHTKRSIWSWLIRLGTHCYWNHALIVCEINGLEEGYDSTIVVDPKTDGSIEMDRAGKYLGRLDKYDVAVKRLEAGWFQDNGQSGKPDIRNLICDIAASEAATGVHPKLAQIINRFTRQVTVIYRFIRRKIKRARVSLNFPWSIRPTQVKAFTCGGFVQWCYYKGVSHTVEKGYADESKLQEVVFNPRIERKVTPFELLTTTPADLANCAKLSWKYVIMNGVIREVSSGEEANLIIATGK
jgi:hypothetical protein